MKLWSSQQGIDVMLTAHFLAGGLLAIGGAAAAPTGRASGTVLVLVLVSCNQGRRVG